MIYSQCTHNIYSRRYSDSIYDGTDRAIDKREKETLKHYAYIIEVKGL